HLSGRQLSGGLGQLFQRIHSANSPTVTYVAGQRFRADGARIGGEFIIDAVPDSVSAKPRVTTLKDGGYVVVWEHDTSGPILTTEKEIWARVFDADGGARSGRFRVDTASSTDAVLPDVAARADGGFQVSWGIASGTRTFDDVRVRSFDANGRALTPDNRMNTVYHDFDQIHARTAELSNGGTVAIWGAEAYRPAGQIGGNGIRGSVFGPDGRVIRADFHLADTIGMTGNETNYGYDVVGLKGGGFALTAIEHSSDVPGGSFRFGKFLLLSLFDNGGRPVAVNLPVVETRQIIFDAALTQLATGEIVATWTQYSDARGEFGRDVMARIMSSDGRPLSPVFEVGIDRGNHDSQEAVEIAALAGGGFVITYDSDSIDADGEGIAMRIFGRGTARDDVLKVDVSGMMAGMGGHDRITGDGRANRIWGGEGNDSIWGGGGHDRLDGGRGNDRLLGQAGNDTLIGGAGADTLNGGRGRDRLDGGAGNDLLRGGDGADTLIGGAGRDRMEGGAGADVFLFRSAADSGPGARADVIADFRRGADRISLQQIDADADRAGDQAFLWGGTRAVAHGVWHAKVAGGLRVAVDADGDGRADMHILLEGISALSAGDFIL
ncbi:MAG: M10 family metallopeptidase C-terminal domain-containing protein, partial [Paracoccus sp. (in: a-proteobacteria)]|nr:M10 family metallopeptidase C-terminal domain-containing protein [Paracoccus sp. (in: a-proteobacteria)]